MTLPYQSATTGKRAMDEIQKHLRQFGCSKFATGEDYDTGEIFIQFEHRGRCINMKASANGYAEAWLKENPYNRRRRCTPQEHTRKAMEIGATAIYSVLRDAIKAQLVLVEIGIRKFEAAFLADIMLPDGRTVIEELESQQLLPAPKE